MAGQPIREVYPDGKIVVSNVRRKVDGSSTSYSVVNNWHDGTAMSDAKVDVFGIYSKYKATGEYLRENLPNWGENFLEADTMASFRTLSAYNLFLIRIGYYKGVRLNGYYAKKDTPSSIEYIISSTSYLDDGGSVIAVGGIKLEHKFIGEVNTLYFGAKGDNTQDDTQFIQKASDYCNRASGKPALLIPEGFNFKITDTVTVANNINVIMFSPISYEGEMDRTALQIGGVSRTNHCRYKINITATNARSDWEDLKYVGVNFINIYSSEICIDQASFFGENFKLSGIGMGCVYNNVVLKDLGHGKHQIHLYSEAGGWVNQNNFYGGRLQRASFINRGKSCFGVKLSSSDGYRQNTNRFYNISVELHDEASRDVVRDSVTNEILEINAPNEVAAPILVENGRHNKFEIRDEGNTCTIITDNDSHNNEVQAIFSAVFARYESRVRDMGLFPSTKFSSNIQTINQEVGWQILNIPSIKNYVNKYNSTTSFVTAPLRLQNRNSGGSASNVTGVSIGSDYVEIDNTAGLGVRIDTTLKKRFNIAASFTDLDHAGRIYLTCRDADGIIIDPASVSGMIRVSGRYDLFEAPSSFGGSMALASGTSGDRDLGGIMQFFAVSHEVKAVDVFFSHYQNPCRLKGFSIHSIDGFCPIISYNDWRLKTALEIPSTTTFNGDFVLSVSANQIGWKQSGGLWREIGGNATTTSKGLVSQSAYQSPITQADLSSLSAIDLVGVVSWINESLIPLVNVIKESQNTELENHRSSGQQANI